MKNSLLDALKIHSQRFYQRFYFHYVLVNGLNGVIINLLTYLDHDFVINFTVVYLTQAQYHLISSNTTQFEN